MHDHQGIRTVPRDRTEERKDLESLGSINKFRQVWRSGSVQVGPGTHLQNSYGRATLTNSPLP